MKKIVSVALASIMLLSGLTVFAGCGKEYITEVNWDVDLSNPIPLKGLYPETGMGAFGRDDTAKIIERVTGYKVTYEQLGSNADSDVNSYLSTLEQYHFMKLTEAQYHPYLAGGTFCDLTEFLEKTEPGRILYQLIDLMDYGWDSVTYVDPDGTKHIYGIPDFGYVSMTDSAMVWNRYHLQLIGFEEKYPDTEDGLPETMEQVTWALTECQKMFGADNDKYHAFGIPGGNSCEITQLKGAFEVPFQFYIDDDGMIQQYVYSENTTNYAKYMSSLFHSNDAGGMTEGYGSILSSAWQSESQTDCNQKFARELYSCVFMPYWYMLPLYESIRSYNDSKDTSGNEIIGIPDKMGLERNENGYLEDNTIRDNVIGWQLRVRGDGTSGSVNQEKARIEGGPAGVSYYTVIPAYMQDTALYTIDFLAKKMLYFADFYGGNEGTGEPVDADDINDPNFYTHWYEIDTPEGAPSADDYQSYLDQGLTPDEIEQIYNEYEDLPNRNIFLRPYEFSYTRYYNTDSAYGNVLDEATMASEVITVSRPGKWVHLTQRYVDQINDNSQYCNGTNAVSARVLFHLRETGFGAWRVVIPTDDTLIQNPMAMCPPMSLWAPVSILSRTLLKDGIKSAINASDPEVPLNTARENAKKRNKKDTDGNTFYYWSDAISEEMTNWYNEVKLNRN